jgi:Patatin-like phospholipase
MLADMGRAGSGGGVVLPAMLIAAAAALLGCTTDELPRPSQSQAEMISSRDAANEQRGAEIIALVRRNVARIKAEYDAYATGRASEPPIVDILVISGGGDWGAFGAGVLKGWGRVPPGAVARPTFDAVTGVSTGALIAPFAFLGDHQSIEKIAAMYRNPQDDWIRRRLLYAFLSGGASFVDIPGLEAQVRRTLDWDMLQRLAEEGRDGRILAVNTSNLDYGEMRVWDIVAEAQRALDTGKPDRVYDILLASSAIPGAFPPREIDGRLFVDGAITGNILYGAAIPGEDGFAAQWMRAYPDVPPPKIRYWIIFNNQFRPSPEVVQPRWSIVLPRSTTTATRSSTVNSIRHLFALAEVSRLKRNLDVEVRYIAVPDNWVPPKPGVFDKDVMNTLADMGERMGADPASWRSDPPP